MSYSPRVQRAQNSNIIIIIIIIIIHSFLYRHKVVTPEAVAEQVRSCQSLSVIVSQGYSLWI